MKATKTVIAFEKSFNGYSTEIEIVFGTNPKGEKFQYINQINTSNDFINQFERNFEDFNISIPEMIISIQGQGYSIKF